MNIRLFSVLLVAASPPLGAMQSPVALDDFGALSARGIGPAGMSGRVSDIDVARQDPNLIFVAAATGGVWRSRDRGLTWTPVFDEAGVQSIGAVAVAPSNPDIVWAGTGEGNPRNSAGVGAGVFRSLDGGNSWELMGLERSERIHRVVIHPEDPSTVYVGAMGPAWSDGEERGVYRTRDGGESWERVLYRDATTGVADLVMDPRNPSKLFAAMWSFRRTPWSFRSGGEGSGLFVTRDGGDSWERIDEASGMPQGELGRIGVAIARSIPNVVYALVEAERNALLRSTDGGDSWRVVRDDPGTSPRPFYYADLRVDPLNENRLYRLSSVVEASEDAGRSFRVVVPSRIVHGDIHELWIHPEDPRYMILGEDGGIAVSYDRGDHWRFVENLPLAQFYHLDVDMSVPFQVYGGLQDNGSWHGPMTTWSERGIMNLHWTRVGSGDGFRTLPGAGDRDGYSMSQGGNLYRFDRETGNRTVIRPTHPDGAQLRFSWNAALHASPHDPETLYLGSQFVHRTRDRGASWEIISPDLTTNDPLKQRWRESGGLTIDASGAEAHTTILSIQESPVTPGVIWATTDDGNAQVTENGGATWTNVGENVPGVPEAAWAPHVEPSSHDARTAYLVYDDHRRGDWTPYLYRTRDLGNRWERLDLEGVQGFVHTLEEDPAEPRLLFLGTEFGMYVSMDGGSSWERWESGLPPAPVRGIVVHPRDHALAIGTHGRAAYIIDDVLPLRALAADPSVAAKPLHAIEPQPAIQYLEAEAPGYRSTGHAMFMGERRPYGALLHYWMADAVAESVQVEIQGPRGETTRLLQGPASKGLNRVVWDLRGVPEGVEGLSPDEAGTALPRALPGRYRVEFRSKDDVAWATVLVEPDPRIEFSTDDRRQRILAQAEMSLRVQAAREAEDRVEEVLASVRRIQMELAEEDRSELVQRAQALADELAALAERLFTGPACQGMCRADTPLGRVAAPARRINSGLGALTDTDRAAMRESEAALDALLENVDQMISGEVAAFGEALREAGHTGLPELWRRDR